MTSEQTPEWAHSCPGNHAPGWKRLRVCCYGRRALTAVE